jgi:hypothetical protein
MTGVSGAAPRIDIVITDKGADVAKANIVGIGQAAVTSGKQVAALNVALGRGVNSNAISQAAATTVKLTNAIDKQTASYLKNETALNKAISAEQRAIQSANASVISKNKVTISNNAVAASYLSIEGALSAAVVAENKATQSTLATSAAQNKLIISNNAVQSSYLGIENQLNRSVILEQQSAQAVTATSIAQNRLKISNDAVAISYLKVETALSDAIRSEAQAGLAVAKLAAFNDKAATSALAAAAADHARAKAADDAAAALLREAEAAKTWAQREAEAAGFIVPAGIGQRRTTAPGNGTLRPTGPAPLDTFNKGTGQAADNVDKLGKRIGLTNNEMVNLGYQLQDIGVSLAGGQNPFLVLLQQGGQIQGIYSRRGEGLGAVFSDIAGIIAKMITPARLLTAAFAVGAIAFKSFASDARDITETAKTLGQTIPDVQALGAALNNLSTGKVGFDNLKTDVKDFGVALSNAARDGDSQLARLWKDNGLSIKNAKGEVKGINDLLKDAALLVKNAKTEFDKIELLRIMGLSEDWIKILEKGPSALQAAEDKAKTTGEVLNTELVEKAALFDKAWDTSWNNFKTNAGTAISSVKGFLADMILNGSQGIADMIDPYLRNPKLYGMGPQGALGQAIGPDGRPVSLVPEGTTPQQLADQAGRAAAEAGSRWSNVKIDPTDPNALRNVLNGWARDNGVLVGGKAVAPANSNRPDNVGNAPASGLIPSRPGANQKPDNVGTEGASDLLPNGGSTIVPGPRKPKEDHTLEKRADALAKVNRELDTQIALYGKIGPEREREQQLADITNQLLTKKITLTPTENEQFKEKIALIQKQNEVQEQLDRVYNDATDAQRTYNNTLEAANILLAKGTINQKDWAKSVGDARIAVLEQSESVSDGIELGFLKIKKSQDTLSGAIGSSLENQFNSLSDTLTTFASTGTADFASFANSVISDVGRMIVQFGIIKPALQALGIGDAGTDSGGGFLNSIIKGIGSIAGSLFGSSNIPSTDFYTDPAATTNPTLGFAGGGSFVVKGAGRGGVDKTPVNFNATDGERVTVETPAQQMRQPSSGVAAGGSPVAINIDNSGNTGVEVQPAGQGTDANGRQFVDLIVKKAINEMDNRIAKGGNTTTDSLSKRFGLNTVAGNQR